MGWFAERIEKEILLTGIDTFDIPAEEVVSAFGRVERVLGTEWLESGASGKGIASASQIVGMGLCLQTLEGVSDSGLLIRQLRRRDQSAVAELSAMHILSRGQGRNLSIDLHPDVGTRKADFRVRDAQSSWTYVEVMRPMASKDEKRISAVLHTLTHSLRSMECQFALHISLLREPTSDEIKVLDVHLPEFCRLPGKQQATLIDGMGYLFLNHTEVGQLLFLEVPETIGKPRIGVAMFTGGGPFGRPHHQVSIAVPFTDERGDEIFRKESKQLPADAPGLIMLNVVDSQGNFDAWSSLIVRRFQPKIHTRVSGVILFSDICSNKNQRYDFRPETRLLSNQYAKYELPDWIRKSAGGASAP